MPEGRPGGGERGIPRVVITGSESTGKTTLARQLAAAVGTTWVPEFARMYAESAHRPLTAEDVAPIALGQRAAEDQAMAAWVVRWGAEAQWPPLILDTDLISTTVYAEHYYGACPEWISQAAHDRLAPLYLLCHPDLAWRADGVRDQPAARRQLHAAFAARLAELGALVLHVTGTGTARLDVALAALRGWRAMQADRR